MDATVPVRQLDRESETFVETALKLSGKSAEEARTTGALDRADEQVEKLFAPKYQTTGSPVHRAVWDNDLPGDLFVAGERPANADAQAVMQKSLELIRERRQQKTLYDPQGKVSPQSLEALSAA